MNTLVLSLCLVVVLAEDYDAPRGRANQRGCVFPTNVPPNLIIRMQGKGRIMRFICPTGSLLVGKRFSTCLRGRWSNPPPICISTGCTPQTTPLNGRVTESYEGGMLTFGCNPGYIQNGIGTIYCALYQWNGTAPTCTVPTTNPSLTCDFEDPDLCGWSHDFAHNFEWKRNKFTTPSGHVGTGPSFDHTLGKGMNGHYMYLEASSPQKEGDITRLFSPVYPTMLGGSCFTFWYHMYGSSIGSLRVYLKGDNQVLAELSPAWSKDHETGNVWLQGQIDIPQMTINFQIVIEGVRGSDYMGDIAFDDVSLVQDSCPVQTNQSVTIQEGSVTVATTTDEGGGGSGGATVTQLTTTTAFTGEASTSQPLTTITKEPFAGTTLAIASRTVSKITSSLPSTREQVTNTPGTSRVESTPTETTRVATQSQQKDCVIDTSNSTENSDRNWMISLSNCSSVSPFTVFYTTDDLKTIERTTVEYTPMSSAAVTITSSSPRVTTSSISTQPYTFLSTTVLHTATTISPTTNPVSTKTIEITTTPLSTIGTTTQSTTTQNTHIFTTRRFPFFPKKITTAATTTTTPSPPPPPPPTTTTIAREISYTNSISLPTTSTTTSKITRKFLPVVTTTSPAITTTITTPSSTTTTTTRKPFIYIVPKTDRTESNTPVPSTTPIVLITSTIPTLSTTTRRSIRFPTKGVTTLTSTTDIRSLFPHSTEEHSEDDDDEEVDHSGQNDDSNVDTASIPEPQSGPDSSARWQKFPERQHPRTKATSGAGASAIATACSLGAVALVVCVFAVFYLARRRKLQKQRFASNSEMRFITHSEELELGGPDNSDTIKLI